MTTYTPPSNISKRNHNRPSIFLAGSIDMGAAVDWQKDFIDAARECDALREINIFNPRRSDWDSS